MFCSCVVLVLLHDRRLVREKVLMSRQYGWELLLILKLRREEEIFGAYIVEGRGRNTRHLEDGAMAEESWRGRLLHRRG